MAKPKKKAERREIHISPETAATLRRSGIHLAIACVFFGAIGVGFYYVKQYVDREVAMPTEPPTIVIKNRPHWMSDFLVQRIAATARPSGLHSAYDHDMLVQARKALETNPWVSKVYEVRRAYREKPGDTLEIDCEYRVPVALVKWGLFYWLVDGNGFKLPEAYEPADVPKIVVVDAGRIDIRIIDGVKRPPPEKPGQKWVGEDLAAGLEMIRLLSDKPYAQDILKVSVANFNNPREPHVVLLTKYGTEVRWGRTPSELDREPFMEVSTARKLDRLKRLYNQYGRVDAGHIGGLDIRFDDSVKYPGDERGPTRTASGG
ncbi:MAG TPA: hypothetical protein VG269_12765 [Tepidisphaeraceae bacterium]|nr:hypothetical protein [Tepidisphaeraceae bacterium]